MHLIDRLAPCNDIVDRLLEVSIPKETPTDWSKLFSIDTPYESMYTLFIAQAFLADNTEIQLVEEKRKSQILAWKTAFLTQSGLKWAIKVYLTQ